MELTKERLDGRLTALKAQREQLVGQVNVLSGMVMDTEHLIKVLASPEPEPEPETPDKVDEQLAKNKPHDDPPVNEQVDQEVEPQRPEALE